MSRICERLARAQTTSLVLPALSFYGIAEDCSCACESKLRVLILNVHSRCVAVERYAVW